MRTPGPMTETETDKLRSKIIMLVDCALDDCAAEPEAMRKLRTLVDSAIHLLVETGKVEPSCLLAMIASANAALVSTERVN